MILVIALFLAVLFGAVGTVTGYNLALRRSAQKITAAAAQDDRAHDLAQVCLSSRTASLDPEVVVRAQEITANRKDTNH